MAKRKHGKPAAANVRILASLDALGRSIRNLQRHLEALRDAGSTRVGKKTTTGTTRRKTAARSTRAKQRG